MVGAIAFGAYDLAMWFDDLFSSGPSLPPNYFVYQARLQRGRRHPLYTKINGIESGILDEEPAALAQDDGPSPYQYYQWAKTANWLENLVNLYEFHRGGSLDAQAYGASPAYANYVYGVYMAARGYSVSTALSRADEYAYLRSHYRAGTPMSRRYPSIPAANVGNITNGFKDERKGDFGLP